MGKKISVSILCLLIISFSAISVSAQTCDESAGNYKPNSPYGKNLRLIFSTLASNVTPHDGYFNGSIGLGHDTVYAMGMCAPGAGLDACSNCIKAASDGLLQTCPDQTDAFSWFGEEILCLVRYSSKSFSGVLVLKPFNVFNNLVDIKKEDQKEFDSVWDGLMFRMITVASSSVRNNSSSLSSSSSKYYAKDVVPVPVYGNISVSMQCTPDVSSKDCKLCLQSSVDYSKTWFHGKRGSIILRPSCFFRWELYIFSGAFDNIRFSTPPSQPPSLPPSPPPSVADLSNNPQNKDKRLSGGMIAAIVIVILVINS